MKTLESILRDIHNHNEAIFKNNMGQPIDFSKTKKSWGSDVIPEEFWIDITKNYKTRDGKKVILDGIVMKNEEDNEVTYPIKGSIITPRKDKKDSVERAIWSLDGREDVLGFSTKGDLVLV